MDDTADRLIKDFMFIWATIDPIGTLALFTSLTATFSPRHRNRIALKATLYSAIILLSSIVVGQIFLSYMGIQLISLQLSGGIILFLFGLHMVFKEDLSPPPSKEPNHGIAVFPLAIPSIATPGAIMAVIVLTDNALYSITSQLLTALLLLIVLGITYIFMLLSTPIMKFLGKNGSTILVKLMGMVLTALSIEIIMDVLNIPEWVSTLDP